MLEVRHKKYLKSLAHSLKPLVKIGQKGLTSFVVTEIKKTAIAHELIKIQLPSKTQATEKDSILDNLRTFLDERFSIVDRIGRNIILFYREADQKKARIKLDSTS